MTEYTGPADDPLEHDPAAHTITASIRSLIVTRSIVPVAFRKLDAIAVLTGPLLPAPQYRGGTRWRTGP